MRPPSPLFDLADPFTSVVLVTRHPNREAVRAVASCLSQDYEPFEVIV